MTTLLWILISTFIVSLLSFIGILTLSLKKNFLEKILMILVSLSAGALLGGAFLHLIPEATEQCSSQVMFIYILLGFLTFLFIEKILHWHHCHNHECQVHSFAHMNLIGDSMHNFIDGLIIAAGFIAGVPVGIAATIAVALHEIPQEIGDFGVLIYAGFKRTKALFINFITALTAILGGIIGYFLSTYSQNIMVFLIPFAAGSFIYIAASDLIPEIKKEANLRKSIINFVVILLGISLMYSLKFI
jgi:zinc and cadmium transporter